MMLLFCFIFVIGLLLIVGFVFVVIDILVGIWKIIDDKIYQLKLIVEIIDNNGELQVKVVKVLNFDEGLNLICKECDGVCKNQLIEGMIIMWGVIKDDDVWDGGKIFDLKNGKEYKVKFMLMDGGQKFDVYGYIGFVLFGCL